MHIAIVIREAAVYDLTIDSSSPIAAFTAMELRSMKIQLKFQSIVAIVPRGARLGALLAES